MKRTLTVLATLATTAGTVLVVAPHASAQDCPDPVQTMHHRAEDFSSCETTEIGSLTDWPAEGTGGLILRDEHGNDLGSGIGEGQMFEFIECGPENSGLIEVNQLTRGTGGGWGSLYKGYVKVEWTALGRAGFNTYKDICPNV